MGFRVVWEMERRMGGGGERRRRKSGKREKKEKERTYKVIERERGGGR